jgi:NADPH2:quinone reductase
MVRSLSVSGGSLQNYLLTRNELMCRANDVMEGIRKVWLKLRIYRVFLLAQATEAHRLLESRQTIGKLLLDTGTFTA